MRIVALIGLALAAVPGARSAQDELADLVPSARGHERLERSLVDLASRDWVDTDPGVIEARRRYADSPDLGAAVETAIAVREWDAIRNLLASPAVPEREKIALLVELLDHEARGVAAFCAAVLVQRDAFEEAHVLAEAVVGWSPGSCYEVIGMVHPDRPNAEWLPVARQVIQNARRGASDGDPIRAEAAWRAAWVLVHSTDPADHVLVREVVLVFPTTPRLWVALSRVGGGPEHRRLAEALLNDASAAPGLRASAGLTLLGTDPDAGDEVLGLVLPWLRDFGSRAGLERSMAGMPSRDPAWLRRYEEGRALLCIVDELPTELLRSRLDELLPLLHGEVGAVLLEVLGDRMPQTLFDRLAGSPDPIPEDVHRALFDVADGDPARLARLRALISADVVEQLVDEAGRPGLEHLGVHPRLERGLGGLNRIGFGRLWRARR